MDLNVYLRIECTETSEKLVKAGVLSTRDRIMRFLDGLPMKLRKKALEFCMEKDWRLSVTKFGTAAPDFRVWTIGKVC